MTELKSCPFCGNAPKLTDYYGQYDKQDWVVRCESCDLALDGDATKEAAVTRWNTRANPPTPEPDELEPIEKIAPTEIEISGPYHYDGKKHPCLRLDAPERIVGVVYIVGDDKERAFAEAQTIKEAFRLGGKEIDRIHYASANPPTEPVAWQFKHIKYSGMAWDNYYSAISKGRPTDPNYEVRPLYATPTPEPVAVALKLLADAVLETISEAKRRLDADIPKDAPVHPVSAYLTGLAIDVGKARAVLDATPTPEGGEQKETPLAKGNRG